MTRYSLWRITGPVIAVALAVAVPVAYGMPGHAPQAIEGGYPPADFTGKIALSPDHGPAGILVTISGSGLPANMVMDVVWVSVEGSWVLKGPAREEFHGRQFDLAMLRLKQTTTDSQGRLKTQFRVPVDYGFNHDVLLMQGGVIRNKAGFNVEMQVKVSPAAGPAGTPITIEAVGIGWQAMENSWMVIYDNRFTGVLTAVTTDGRARAIVPASGGPGTHVIRIVHGSFTFPYMNMQQSPRPERPTFTATFTVTEGKPVLPSPPETQALVPWGEGKPAASGPSLWAKPTAAPVGTPVQLNARGLQPGLRVRVVWWRIKGNTEGGQLPEEAGWRQTALELGRGVVKPDGTLSLTASAPDDLGGPHPIALLAGEDVLAETSFTITPSALPLMRRSGPAGTPFIIHLQGVGWTQTANIYHIVYDNAYIGYACGFNSQGDVQIHLWATGAPGWHFIDLYPGIYKGTDARGVDNFRIPQLTYAADHPGERLPAFRFAFLVTK